MNALHWLTLNPRGDYLRSLWERFEVFQRGDDRSLWVAWDYEVAGKKNDCGSAEEAKEWCQGRASGRERA